MPSAASSQTRAAPLTVRRWAPKTRMIRGCWNIPPPGRPRRHARPRACPSLPAGGRTAITSALAEGSFDRTLAAPRPRPFGVGGELLAARLTAIHPPLHDIRLDLILTEAAAQTERDLT